MTDHIDEIIEKFRPQPPEEFDWHEGHVRAAVEAAENSGYVKGYKDGSNTKTAAEMQDARIGARRALAQEILGYGDVVLMVKKLREIAEEA